jgi:hypothetical protein
LDYPTAQSIFVAALLCLIALPRQVVFDPTTTSSYRQVDAAGASRVLPPAGLAMDSRNRVDIGSHAPPNECTSSVKGHTVVHPPAIAVGNPGNAVLPASDQSLAERYRSGFFAVMGLFLKNCFAESPHSRLSHSPPPVTLGTQLITALSILQGIMVYILGNPPLDNASTGSGSPEAIAFVLQYPVQTLSFLLRRQNYAPSLQTLA